MKKLVMILVSVGLASAFATPANAVTWSFQLSSSGDSDTVFSGATIVVDPSPYEYSWEFTNVQLQVQPGTTGPVWESILADITSSGGPDIQNDPLPIDVSDQHIDHVGITADISLQVLADGRGSASVSNISFGQFIGSPVTAFQAVGSITVTSVPEPATIAMLGLGVLGLIRKKRA